MWTISESQRQSVLNSIPWQIDAFPIIHFYFRVEFNIMMKHFQFLGLQNPRRDFFFSLFFRKEIYTSESDKKLKQANQKGNENKKTRKEIKQDIQKGN